MTDYIRTFVNIYLFKNFEPLPNEDLIVEQIKTSSLDKLYEYSTSSNDSLLHISIYFNKHKMIDALLEKKMFVDYPNYHNETPLHYAACYQRYIKNDITNMEKLIKHGANVNAASLKETYKHCIIGNFTPLKYAVSQGAINAINCLVQNGAYVTLHSISKCKKYIEEHMFTDEDYMMLIDMKWSHIKNKYEKKLDNNLNMVMTHFEEKIKHIPYELSTIIRSYMNYTSEDIENIIKELERR
jgi:hypothetical protein